VREARVTMEAVDTEAKVPGSQCQLHRLWLGGLGVKEGALPVCLPHSAHVAAQNASLGVLQSRHANLMVLEPGSPRSMCRPFSCWWGCTSGFIEGTLFTVSPPGTKSNFSLFLFLGSHKSHQEDPSSRPPPTLITPQCPISKYCHIKTRASTLESEWTSSVHVVFLLFE
jgi:hypothetical protein